MNADAAKLRTALSSHGYTMSGVLGLLGTDALAALGRGETAPSRRVLAALPAQPLIGLVRLFLLGEPVAAQQAAAALPVAAAAALGLIRDPEDQGHRGVRALHHIQPYPMADGDGFVVSDFPPGRSRSGTRLLPFDHVTGVGGASVTLAAITPRRQVARMLDLGTGSGIQALLASDHSRAVVATDRSERAVAMAALTAALSGCSFDLRAGSLFEPVAGETFDLVVANPPFVMAPEARYTYREAPMPADDLGRTVVGQAAEHLRPGGLAVVLANWLHVAGQPWQERLAGWAPPGCQVWIGQREYLSAAEYVELWLKDSGETGTAAYDERYAHWYGYLDGLGTQGVGFGWVVLRRSDPSWCVAEDLAGSERLPSGEEVLAQIDRITALQDWDAIRVLGAAPYWTQQTELHRSWHPATGASTGIVATGAWRPAQDVDPLVADVLERRGTLGQRLEQLEGLAADEATVRALIGLRGLFGAGLIGFDG